ALRIRRAASSRMMNGHVRGLAQELPGFPSEHPFCSRILKNDPALKIQCVNAFGNRLEHQSVPAMKVLQLFDGPRAFRNFGYQLRSAFCDAPLQLLVGMTRKPQA